MNKSLSQVEKLTTLLKSIIFLPTLCCDDLQHGTIFLMGQIFLIGQNT